jgi:DNA-directed RNA polymerase III subunit RPC2
MVVMKAMGMESDQEVVQMVGRDPRFSILLLPSIEVSNMVKDLKSAMNFFVASLRYLQGI